MVTHPLRMPELHKLTLTPGARPENEVMFIGYTMRRFGVWLPSMPHLLLHWRPPSLRGTDRLVVNRMSPWTVPRDSGGRHGRQLLYPEDTAFQGAASLRFLKYFPFALRLLTLAW